MSEGRYDLHGVWGVGGGVAFAVGQRGLVLRTVDGGWSWQVRAMGDPATVEAMWGSGPNHLLAVGTGGLIIRSRDGGDTWLRQQSGTQRDLHAIWGSGLMDIYAVGAGGVILHSEDGGESWALLDSGTSAALSGVWGSGRDDIYISAGDGTVLKKDGTGWSRRQSGTGLALHAIWGSSASAVYAAGSSVPLAQARPAPLKRSADAGDTWTTVATVAGNDLRGLHGSGGAIYAAGDRGALLYSLDGGRRFREQQTGRPLRAVFAAGPRDVYLAGDGGVILRGE